MSAFRRKRNDIVWIGCSWIALTTHYTQRTSDFSHPTVKFQ